LLTTASISSETFAQTSSAAAGKLATEVAVGYTYVRANAPPGECDCFSMNGGSMSVAQPFKSGTLAWVFDATLDHASGISAGNYDLTLSIYSVGLRYRPWADSNWSPFSQVLLGASHASGSLVQGNTPAAADGSLRFAATVGGGIDYWVNSRWSLRAFEADYLVTTYSNRTDDHQNNLRISVGAAYHFGARRTAISGSSEEYCAGRVQSERFGVSEVMAT
jgi:outer membrane immunogenic protein